MPYDGSDGIECDPTGTNITEASSIIDSYLPTGNLQVGLEFVGRYVIIRDHSRSFLGVVLASYYLTLRPHTSCTEDEK